MINKICKSDRMLNNDECIRTTAKSKSAEKNRRAAGMAGGERAILNEV